MMTCGTKNLQVCAFKVARQSSSRALGADHNKQQYERLPSPRLDSHLNKIRDVKLHPDWAIG